MSLYSPSIEKLIESFEKLPSIGHKTAARLAFYMLNSSEEETKEFESTAGGGAVSVKVTGEKTLKEIKLKPEIVDPDDIEMLQDLILTCINDALKKVDSAQAASMGKYNIPGIM